MAWIKRIFLFLVINFLVVITISTITSLLGIQPYLTAQGLDLSNLMAFCLIWGMGGAFISLALSRVMAKWLMRVQVIPANAVGSQERFLLDTVRELSMQAGLSKMPEVGVYESPDINAFATGPTKNRSLVAVSSALLQRLDRQEARGVLAHEIAHVANGDMVTMTLIQGIVNAFVMFLARVIAYAVVQMTSDRDSDAPVTASPVFYLTTFVLEIVFMIAGSMVVAAFSRWREFRADAGGAKLGGRESMIQALRALKQNLELPSVERSEAVATLQIFSKGRSWTNLFMTHPSLDDRIRRLESRPA